MQARAAGYALTNLTKLNSEVKNELAFEPSNPRFGV
jgi:hypothetical protein